MNSKTKATSFAALAKTLVDYGSPIQDPAEFLARAEASFEDGKLVLPSNVIPSATRKGDLVLIGKSRDADGNDIAACFMNLMKLDGDKYDGKYGTLNIIKFKDGTHKCLIRAK